MERLTPGVDPARVPPGVRRSGGPAPVRHRPRCARRRLRRPADPPQGPGHCSSARCREVLAAVPEARLLVVGGGKDGPRLADLAAEPRRRRRGRVHRAGAVDGRRRPTSTPATCSRCRAAPGSPAWSPRRSGSCSSRRRPPACRCWSVAPGVPRTPCWTGRPGTSSTRTTSTALAERLVELLRDPDRARTMGAAGRAVGRAVLDLGPGRRAARRAAGLTTVVDMSAHEARRGDQPLALTAREFNLLGFLLSHPGECTTRTTPRAGVRMVVRRPVDRDRARTPAAREDLGATRLARRRITTVWGVGYRLRTDPGGR